MNIQSLSAALPQQLTLKAVNRIHNHYTDPNDPTDTSYVDLVIEDGGALNGTVDGFCIDSDRDIGFGVDENFNGQIDANTNEVGSSYTAKVYSSYEPLPDALVGTGLIEKPENLDLLNWIINQDFTYQTSPSGGNYTWADLQRAIWTLIDDENSTAGGVGPEGDYWQQARVDEIVAAARTNGEGFVPSFGQKMGVIIVPDTDGDGAPDAQIQFAAIELAKLGDKVFADSNNNGLQDAAETGVAGVTVNLLADINGDGTIEANEVIDTTTTDENGEYSFTVVAGDYKVQFEAADGQEFTSANAGNDALDSDADVVTGMTGTISLNPGEYNSTIDAGIVVDEPKASLGDRVWYDTDGDGVQDAGEKGVEGVKVTLTGGGADGIIGTADDTTAETTTDANGNYLFDNLNAGEEYKVTFSHLPEGYEFTAANATEITGEEVIFDSSFESAAKRTGFVKSGLEGWQSTDGYIEIHSTHNSADGRNHIELNDDAINYFNDARNIYRHVETEVGKQYTLTFQYAARPGFSADVNAMEVRLDGSTLLALEEDGSGSRGYNWKTYTVSFEGDGTSKQLEFLSTGQALAYGRGARLDDIKLVASMGSNDDTRDSDADPISGMSHIVTLEAGKHNSTIDAGIVEKPVITTGQIIGHDCIHEGDSASYQVKLDGIVTKDTYVTINIDNGSAKQADGYHQETIKSLSNPYTHNVKWGEKGQLYTANHYDRYYASRYWNGTHWFSGDLNQLPVGAQNLTDDFEVAGAQGDKLVVKIAAGSDTSESFDISALKEIQLGKMFSRVKATEGTESFSLNIEKIGDIDVNTGAKQIHIKDNYANYSPISFDLNGDGVQTVSIDQGVMFDMLNTGTAVNTGWLSGEDGFLAVDNNGDGLISSRAELFGGLVGDGFAKLETFDSNGDGLVNESDDLFGDLRLWQDSNENGFTDQGELVSLTTAGITDLVTGYTDVFSTDAHGNVHGEHSSAKRNGSTIDMVDVYFQVAV
ncbi:SdrD B-like domain-containing protein [Leptothoe kymatousa]|uniref:SD-repeat containing protein B domain-containing protein n=1 Tax=Leptothoe kymatousa TAU-MAC 1615 TaxID=2364775 RepID=A0ABS5Y5Z3_9CYAN|nr:SdrD B-like domain-containing protein [Leptothoe kymatousa]MBT9313238.1 hypothetical protein [Leptothoe kymatousa TAU-MAC 1615]